jgi:hypothetical protein
MVGEVAAEQALGLPSSTELDFLTPDREAIGIATALSPDVS